MRRHFNQYGKFSAEANQAGVEFDIKLENDCSLGKAGRWFGWQCRWYDLASGRAIGTTRRAKIEDAIRKTEVDRPGITDWVLWTRHPLTAGDQAWFHAIQSRMSLYLWTSVEVEEYLNGPAEIFRSTYFGNLVLTPERLEDEHKKSIARIQRRWQPEIHQIVEVEHIIRQILFEPQQWMKLNKVALRLTSEKDQLLNEIPTIPTDILVFATEFTQAAIDFILLANETYKYLLSGDFYRASVTASSSITPSNRLDGFVRRLRSKRNRAVLIATNVLADMHLIHRLLHKINRYISIGVVAITGDAGYGKTEISASLTSKSDDRSAGILLHGTDLSVGHSLDDLAKRVVIQGMPVTSFEALTAAIDAAGRRSGKRIPIVIDGLNESEDPRVWKNLLAPIPSLLHNMPYVVVICTLRSAFADEALPDGIPKIHTQGFGNNVNTAIFRYFEYYKIDAKDALIPVEMLRHPLTLRIFCEVANPERRQTVGVGAIPASLTTLFTRYLNQAASRIAELATRNYRYYESDVLSALIKMGQLLWEQNTRSIEINALRQLLCDHIRPWDTSIIRALEHEGILLRTPGEIPGTGHVSIVYDLLAGHIVADAILGIYPGQAFENWVKNGDMHRILPNNQQTRHPLSHDIFRALAGIVPVKLYGHHFWKYLDGQIRSQALYEASLLESSLIDRETVEELEKVIYQSSHEAKQLFHRLRVTRAAQPHPLNADFLDEALQKLSMPDRDLLWTEWLRNNHQSILSDIERLEHQWKSENEAGNQANRLRATWLMWTLTSNVITIRDHATRALYHFGCIDPQALFELSLRSLSINDLYVSERMLASCYGVSMALWTDLVDVILRASLPTFAEALIDAIFIPEASYPISHVLSRDYALGCIALALKIAPNCIAKSKMAYIKPPLLNIQHHFADPYMVTDSDIIPADSAIGMNFGNYTIGGLVEGRRNYDYDNREYSDVIRQIKKRIVDLGYRYERFHETDDIIRERGWRAPSEYSPKTERYGKKYSRIAYFEMYGVRDEAGKINHTNYFERTSEADIDPSFPQPPPVWSPIIPDVFDNVPDGVEAWMANGPTPDFSHLILLETVDGEQGPWVMIDGHIQLEAKTGGREIFTVLKTLFVKTGVEEILKLVYSIVEHPGNYYIPDSNENHYTYVGEVPWSSRFGHSLRRRDGHAKRHIDIAFYMDFGQKSFPGVSVEIPVSKVGWGGTRSPANYDTVYRYPAPAICNRLKLSGRRGQPDLYDATSRLATIYREIQGSTIGEGSHLLYLRADLAAEYLRHTGQTLTVLAWGERGYNYEHPFGQGGLHEYYAKNQQIHKTFYSISPDQIEKIDIS